MRNRAPMTWPAFVASCEAEPEDRMVWERWWERVLRYGIANLERQWKVVRGVWEGIDKDGGGNQRIDWIEIFLKEGFRVLPI